jgi:hypothetical protein
MKQIEKVRTNPTPIDLKLLRGMIAKPRFGV